jgi:hypothetical protein
MNKKHIIYIILICSVIFYTKLSFASSCTGCCSTHGGVICSGGVTKCADETPLSQTCVDKGCDACLAICSYNISDTNQTFASAGGAGNLTVTASDSSCSWNAITDDSWIAVTSGTDYTGSATLYYSISANSGTSSRMGIIPNLYCNNANNLYCNNANNLLYRR